MASPVCFVGRGAREAVKDRNWKPDRNGWVTNFW